MARVDTKLRKRVLIVDDDADARELLHDIIGALGHDALAAGSAQEAIRAAERTPLDLALIDLGLPDTDGFEVARRIRATSPSGRARLVALTGFSDAQSRLQAEAAGFDDFLVKPAFGAELESVVNG